MYINVFINLHVISSRQKQGARIEAVRRSGYRDIDHSDRDASGGHHVHLL